jgi:hypothetical protein
LGARSAVNNLKHYFNFSKVGVPTNFSVTLATRSHF